jgi:hypothetical protein
MIGAAVSHVKIVEMLGIETSGHRLIGPMDQWKNEQMNQLP